MNAGVRLDRLVGREVHTADDRRVGRLEEFRVERRGTAWVVTEYLIGAAGLMERVGLGVRLVVGIQRAGGSVGRGDQLDISTPDRPTWTCPVEPLQRR